jgi:Mce-associated membrane protein
MEGDAGASRLNPTGGQERSDSGEDTGGQERSDSGEDTGGQERSDLGEDTPPESEAGSQEAQDQPGDEVQDSVEDGPGPLAEDVAPRRQERLGRGWLVTVCACLLLLTAGVAVGGYLALRSHDQSEAIAREDAVALQRAKDCVSATQAPDVAAMTASQTKIIECATGDFAVQANLFTSMLVEAYQAANVAVQVSDMRGAVEKHNDDGSVDVLVAVRVKVTNSQAADQEQGYRLRVNMAPADGTYKISRLDQVAS